jgi:hypothetical protein
LGNEERVALESVVSKGTANGRQIRRAPPLLLSNAGKTDAEIAALLHVTTVTVGQTRKCWSAERLTRNLADQPQSSRPTATGPTNRNLADQPQSSRPTATWPTNRNLADQPKSSRPTAI